MSAANSQTPTPARRWLDALVRHIRVLGLWRGLKYWRIENACIHEPQRVIQWAENCERESNRCNQRGDKHGSAMMTGWARELRAAHRAYSPNSALNDASSQYPGSNPPA
jgi:hypothetical protein